MNNDLVNLEIDLDLTFGNRDEKNVVYRTKKVKLEYEKNKILLEILTNNEKLFKTIEDLSSKILEEKKKLLKSDPENMNFLEDFEFANERYVNLSKAHSMICNNVRYAEDELYECNKAIKELDNAIDKQDSTLIEEWLTNVKILLNLTKIFSLEEQEDLAFMADNVINNLGSILENCDSDDCKTK